jgi:hypothetical protein
MKARRLLETDYVHAEPPKPPPPVAVRVSPIAVEGCSAAAREAHCHRRSGPCPAFRSAAEGAGHKPTPAWGASRGNDVPRNPAMLRLRH